MRKRIRTLAVIFAVLLIITTASAGGFFFWQKSQNLPIKTPVSGSPKALELTKALTNAGFTIDSVPIETKGAITASVSGKLVVFSVAKDTKTQVKALQLLEQSLKMEPTNPKEIDLRFDKVVVRY